MIDASALERLAARARATLDEGLPSCQLALALDGRVEAFLALGAATPDSRYVLFSVTKALTAGAAWVLFGDGSLSPDTRVADVLPEFAENGTEAVTVEHLMTHTAGFPRAPMRPEEGADPTARAERLRRWRVDWEPGTRTEYHPSSADWALAAVIEAVAGERLGSFVARRITGPLGLPRLQLGPPEDDHADVLPVAVVGQMSQESRQALESVGAASTLAETDRHYLLRYNEPAVRTAGVPGAGALGDAASVARYFQALLNDPAGVWDPEVLADATGKVRNALVDPWTGVPANRTLGLRVAGDDGNAVLRGFGAGVGPRTFGASGVGGQVAWADPDTGLSFSYLTNGLDADPIRAFRRQAAVSELAAACARA